MTQIDTSTEAVMALLEGVTRGPWRMGYRFDSIVADHPTGHDENDTLDAYGGHLVCESVKSYANMDFIIAARELIPALLTERDAALARADAADAKSATLQATLDQTIHGWGEDAVKVAELQAQVAKLTAKLEEITDAVDGIYIFASDTLSGRTDGPDDREWQREGVVEIRNRAMVFATSATLRIVGD